MTNQSLPYFLDGDQSSLGSAKTLLFCYLLIFCENQTLLYSNQGKLNIN